MSQASIIINVSEDDHSHASGLAGTWTVPGKKPGEEFSILVVYPTPEIQDIGDQRKDVHWLKSAPLAKDIVGLQSNASAHTPGSRGTKQKWGLFLCEAGPDVPRELLKALEDETDYLRRNRPIVEYERDEDSKALVAINRYKPGRAEEMERLAGVIVDLRTKFEAHCRTLVQKIEVSKAKANMRAEDARLVAEGDTIWAGPEKERQNINELHKKACRRMGQQRPWCYLAQNLVDCPGCGASIKENILTCPNCAAWLDEGIEELRKMKPKERAMKMYPEKYAEPVQPSGKPQPRA